jgi:competence protein ComEA
MISKNNMMKIIAFVVLIIIVITIFYIQLTSGKSSVVEFTEEQVDELQNQENVVEMNNQINYVIVDLKGAVERPGVYEVADTARVHDVVEMAGGLLENADSLTVNLAERVYDEMKIVVYEVGEPALEMDSPSEQKVKINIATVEEIQTLEGIGPSKALAIVQYREEHGNFKTVEELLNVSGIGEKTLEKLKEHIRIP